MCQPKDKGGRRCPMHQPASIGMKKFMVSQYGLEPGQVEHTFKRLRAEAGKRPNPTVEEYEHFIARSKAKLDNSSLDEKSRGKILRQLEKKLTEGELPDGATFYALKKLQARSRDQKVEFVHAISEVSSYRGINRREALKAFREAYRADTDIYEKHLEDSFDTKSRAVLAKLMDQTGIASTGVPEFSPDPRITRKPVQGSRVITSAGYDPDDGRLEVETVAGVYAFKNVDQDLASRIMQGRTRLLNSRLIGNPDYAYDSFEAAQRDAYGRYCEDCHKYKAISGHVCEPRAERLAGLKEPEAEPVRLKAKNYDEALANLRTQMKLMTVDNEPDAVPLKPKRMKNKGIFSQPIGAREKVTLEPKIKTNILVLDDYPIIPDPEGLKEALDEGKVVPFTAKIPVNESDANLVFEITAYRASGGIVKFEKGAAKCDCATYKRTGSCEHILPPEYRHEINPLNLHYRVGMLNMNYAHDRIVRYLRNQIDPIGSFINPYNLLDIKDVIDYPSYEREESIYTDGELYSYGLPNSEGWEKIRGALDYDRDVVIEMIVASDNRNGIYTTNDDIEIRTQIRYSKDEDNYIVKEIHYQDRECPLCNKLKNKPRTCPHVGMIKKFAEEAVQNTLSEGKYVYQKMGVEERLENLSKEINAEWISKSSDVNEMKVFATPAGVDHSYTANLDQYIADVREAEKKVKNGENPLPFVLENATNGVCAPETGRGFGLELEYVLPSEQDPDEVMNQIAKDLHDAGLSDIDYGTEYHGYSGNRWHIEEDCSVSGEVVSPILYDTPENWEQLQKVCDIIKSHGGKASVATGQHVHMGLGGGSPAEVERRKVGVTQIYAAYEDTLRRVQANPERKKHRNTVYCSPFTKIETPQKMVYALKRSGSLGENHFTSLNLGHQGRVEFRGADGSLDPAHIQAQVTVAAGIVKAAERGEIQGDTIKHSKVGSNAHKMKLLTRGKRTKPQTDDELIVADVELRKFADDILGTDHGRKVMAGIAANTPWQEESHVDPDDY